jgi:regulator of sigma E protease
MLENLLQLLNSAAAIVVVLGLCLMCHEAGHFWIARLCKMRVEEFAFGFGPSLWKRQGGETLYRLNLFPFGGFVKISGMEPGAPVDERGFHSRPRWQGALVVLAGSVFNLLLAILLFAVVTFWTGVADPNDRGIYIEKVVSDSPAEQGGLKPKDQIIAVDGQRHSTMIMDVAADSPAARSGLRAGLYIYKVEGTEVFVPAEVLAALSKVEGDTVSLLVIDDQAADLASQQKSLKLILPPNLRLADTGTASAVLKRTLGLTFEPLVQAALMGYVANRPNQPVAVTVLREGQKLDLTLTTTVTHSRYADRDAEGKLYSVIKPVGRIGIVMRGASRPVGPWEATWRGAAATYYSVRMVLDSIRLIVQRQVAAELSGPVAIMAISAEKARMGWDAVLYWGGLISAIIGVMNLFPFPPFDGFRAVLLGYEGIIQRRINTRTELVVSIAGFVVIIFLFVVLTFKDVANLVRYGTP